jgi:hypothetical protein
MPIIAEIAFALSQCRRNIVRQRFRFGLVDGLRRPLDPEANRLALLRNEVKVNVPDGLVRNRAVVLKQVVVVAFGGLHQRLADLGQHGCAVNERLLGKLVELLCVRLRDY